MGKRTIPASHEPLADRYARSLLVVTQEQQESFREKTVAVIGCGGLGGSIIDQLARLGVGHLIIADGDVFESSNLNRQLLCTEELVGQKKIDAAINRVRAVNSAVEITAFDEFFGEGNCHEILSGADIAVDALDSSAGRRLLGKACEELGIPLVHGAIQGWHAQATVCMPGSRRMEMLYGHDFKPASKGSLPFTPPFCASIEVAQVTELLCGERPTLADKLLLLDMRTMETTLLKLS